MSLLLTLGAACLAFAAMGLLAMSHERQARLAHIDASRDRLMRRRQAASLIAIAALAPLYALYRPDIAMPIVAWLAALFGAGAVLVFLLGSAPLAAWRAIRATAAMGLVVAAVALALLMFTGQSFL